jgi:hypothetical protein
MEFDAENILGPLTSEETEELLTECLNFLTIPRVIACLKSHYTRDDLDEIAEQLEGD